ncbi:MFS transporter [Streptomyces sp. LP05-1]|uniref:MFS transporter n=1 Tax=Streptomyces pyxinae TaxID=2970734 RepID=A0ABT2CJD7_9ACTN|nr:MFS transporter [Streptomyces sp. LP05-1]MCS0636709.1 MFS transporter [Streptomyces sp. LP05-1]
MASALRTNRDFRLLWMSGLFAVLGTQMTALALPLLVLRETGSPVRAGAVGTVTVASLLLTMLPGGVLADRTERRRLMRRCDLGSLAVVTALVVAVLAGRVPLPLVLLVAGAGAVIGGVYGPAASALVRSVVPPADMGTATARLQARSSTARLIGPLVGGALFGLHPVLPFVAEAAGLLASAVCVSLVRTRSEPAVRSGPVFSRRELTAGLVFLWRLPYLRTVLLVFGLGMNFAFGALTFTALTVFSDGGRSGLGSGLVVACTSAGTLAGALLAPRLHPELHGRPLITATCWTCAATAGVLAVVRLPLVAGALCALCMCLATVASIGFLTTLLVVTPGDRVGRVQSAAGFLSSLVQPLGPLAGGALLTALGPGGAFTALGAVLALSAAVVTLAPSARGPVSPPDVQAPAADVPASGPSGGAEAVDVPAPAADPTGAGASATGATAPLDGSRPSGGDPVRPAPGPRP